MSVNSIYAECRKNGEWNVVEYSCVNETLMAMVSLSIIFYGTFHSLQHFFSSDPP